MSGVAPGWYKDPADPTTQRYWDGEGWLGEAIPADATPPPGPPAHAEPTPFGPAATTVRPVPGYSVATRGGSPATFTPPLGSPPGTQGAPAQTEPPAPGLPFAWAQLPPGVVPRPHGLPLASPMRRLLARMVDFLVVLLLVVIADAWLAYRWWQGMAPAVTEIWRRAQVGDTSTANLPTPPAEASALILAIVAVMTAVWFAYEVPTSANSGQTLGKRLLGIKVMRLESEERLGLRRSFRRWGRLGLPTLLWYCYGFGFALQLIDCLFVAIDRPLRQALHDKSAFTVVVRIPRKARRPPEPHGEPSHDKSRGGRHADPR